MSLECEKENPVFFILHTDGKDMHAEFIFSHSRIQP